MTQWEYKIVEDSDASWAQISKMLNDLGSQGWELVSTKGKKPGKLKVFYFKRALWNGPNHHSSGIIFQSLFKPPIPLNSDLNGPSFITIFPSSERISEVSIGERRRVPLCMCYLFILKSYGLIESHERPSLEEIRPCNRWELSLQRQGANMGW